MYKYPCTFATPSVIAASLLETKTLQEVTGEIVVDGEAQFVPAMPILVSNCLKPEDLCVKRGDKQLTGFLMHTAIHRLWDCLPDRLASRDLRGENGTLASQRRA